MHIIGHGIDMVRIQRIKDELDSKSKKWLDNIYSDEERLLANSELVDFRYFAGRFAGKEAVVKALGTGFAGDVTWRGIEILRKDNGAPYVRLNGEVLALSNSLGVTDWLISISYAGGLVMASAIAVGD